MSEVNVFHIKENMDVSDEGITVVTCPECEAEINIAFSNVADDSMALVECIQCPACSKTLDQVHPSEELNRKIADHVAKELLKDLQIGSLRSLTKY